ncbi:trafficking protein-like protein particle complex subunit 2 [Amylocarpus encephaloides]|uniref:Trafficking protein-like protein particle complex subunit 2 n=1 Tax=Amylocarpus encephaloides TaxID=45428 RepID=A0A9P8C831_9HELO|nr:trafficking protein-like protein particle complex subunit 2 [Amylocarpus encephaloides]
MSYYLAIIGTQDNPLFECEFGTAKQGGDGVARFPEQARHMNQFIVHSSLDIVEEVQWGGGQMYLKCIDSYYNNYVSCFMTGGNIKFLLLHVPSQPSSSTATRASTSIAANPTSPQTEEAIKQFFTEVYENWVKTIMNPFYSVNMEVKSPVFRARVMGAGKKYL